MTTSYFWETPTSKQLVAHRKFELEVLTTIFAVAAALLFVTTFGRMITSPVSVHLVTWGSSCLLAVAGAGALRNLLGQADCCFITSRAGRLKAYRQLRASSAGRSYLKSIRAQKRLLVKAEAQLANEWHKLEKRKRPA